ncbi:MAG TPA: DciA family protein [Rhizomicrobium sp.]|jgi:hypothetical protein|nr:DciA family protein [Rhizomicrobium sp.]
MAHSGKDKQLDGSPARRNWAAPVSRDASATGATALARAGFADPTLIFRWAEIVGPEVASLAQPLKLAEGAQGGVLTLKAEPGAAVFLQHEARALCERINAFLGRPAIARLRFVQGPVLARANPSRRSPAKVPILPDDPVRRFEGKDALREALLRLAGTRAARPKPAD